jgi:hypothetical protein
VFYFALTVAPQDSCWPVSYREGNCCNGTLTAITLSMLDAVKGAVTSVRLIDSATGAALRGVADPNVGCATQPLHAQLAPCRCLHHWPAGLQRCQGWLLTAVLPPCLPLTGTGCA